MATLLLVHGAFHGSWCWDRLLPELSARGVAARTVELPFTTAADDEAATVAALDQLIGDGEPVVLLGHSFGGAVISAAGGVGAKGRPGVAHLIYLAAVMVGPNEPVAVGASPGLGALRFDQEHDLVHVDPEQATAAFYHRSTVADAQWACGKLRSMPASVLATPSSRWAWQALPSTYVACTDDQIVSFEAQQRMAAHAGTSIEIDSDHSPFLACPDKLAEVIAPIVQCV